MWPHYVQNLTLEENADQGLDFTLRGFCLDKLYMSFAASNVRILATYS